MSGGAGPWLDDAPCVPGAGSFPPHPWQDVLVAAHSGKEKPGPQVSGGAGTLC